MGQTEDRGRRTIDINRPDRSTVAIISSETLAIVREPGVDNVVLGTGEEEVALFIELDLGQGSFVAWSPNMEVVYEDQIE